MPLVKEKLETKEIIKDMRKNVSVQVDSDFALLLPSGVYEIKKMEPRSKIRTIIVFCLFLAIAGIIGFGYFCQDQVCSSHHEIFFLAKVFNFLSIIISILIYKENFVL
ncbi:uncharacterized protein LOC111683356 isoform X2 [Lucilia cuprina]|uniref:uncharacterized protein LOC111683356 isoform X2 n=1 Tax=Lucilia cuprina TaxID=7375 RepID=UPI001F0697FB|nr:uncharacterized protein LOC111683356 isoform X2 [Lucilia cuprina]